MALTRVKPGTPTSSDLKLEWDRRIMMDKLAEQAYREQFGPRPITTHLIKRGHNSASYQMGIFVITPAFWPFIKRWPQNISVFYTVDFDTGQAVVNGWATHKEILAAAKPYGDGWEVAEEGLLHDIADLPESK